MKKLFKKNEISGNIGLIAVSPSVQGKGYGSSLINACEQELIKDNIFNIDVYTQGHNEQACKFYEKNGFSIKEITNIYHFWIKYKYDTL